MEKLNWIDGLVVPLNALKMNSLRPKGEAQSMLEVPEAYSGQVLDLSPEILKMKLLRPILAGFRAWTQKCSK